MENIAPKFKKNQSQNKELPWKQFMWKDFRAWVDDKLKTSPERESAAKRANAV